MPCLAQPVKAERTHSVMLLKAPASAALVEVKNVSKTYDGERFILEDISFSVAANEVVAIIGPSGCGKSTLLKIMAGLEEPTEGEVHLGDPNFTLVFQYSALFDSMTVFENVAFSLLEPPDGAIYRKQFKKRPLAEIHALVSEKLKLVGLEGTEDQYPSQLSGGMQKRVSFARAVISNPKIIFYDEPTSGLDPLAANVLEDCINKLTQELKAASVVVTHTWSTISRTADRVILLDEGRIGWQGTPKELLETDHPVASKFAHAAVAGRC